MVIAFVNGELGLRTLPVVAARSRIGAVVVHPAERARGRDVFEGIARESGAVLLEAPSLREAGTIERLRRMGADWGMSAGFGYILRAPVFTAARHGTLNLHTSLLPWNRGAHPNVWTIVDETPAGVTLHWVDAGVDTGDILAQVKVPVTWHDTAQTLQARLLDAAVSLVEQSWPPTSALLAGRRPQPAGGTVHRVADLATLDTLPLDEHMPVRRVLNILRARTFPPFRSAGIEDAGQRIEYLLQPQPAR